MDDVMEMETVMLETKGALLEDLLIKIRSAFSETFDVDPQSISIETTPNDIPPWDSMGHISLVSNLERAFGLSFDVDEVMEMENVRQILRIIEVKLAKIT
jgi:acyl carrier protein